MTFNVSTRLSGWLVGWLGFYGISNFVGYSMPNPFLYKSVLFQKNHFSISTQFNCQNIFISSYSVYSKTSNSVYSVYRFCLYTVKFQNSSILNNSVQRK